MWNDSGLTPLGPESLPPELADLGSLLAEDAVEWRRRVPPAEPFARRMRQVLLPVQRNGALVGISEDCMSEPATSITRPSTQGVPGGTPPRPARRVPVPLTAIAAVLVVGLLVGVFATLGQNRARLGGDTATTTASPEVTGTPATATPAQRL